jgi:hypothetical protein
MIRHTQEQPNQETPTVWRWIDAELLHEYFRYACRHHNQRLHQRIGFLLYPSV